MSDQPQLHPESARQGEVSGRIRYVLLGGTAGAVVTLAIVALVI
ncbi:MAG: hypothetical protein ACMVY4_06970 [Minwuia sp.]